MTRWLGASSMLAAMAMLTLGAASAEASNASHVRHAASQVSPSSDGPAHMIEVAPGNWVSSYQCVLHDANNRIVSCDSIRNGD